MNFQHKIESRNIVSIGILTVILLCSSPMTGETICRHHRQPSWRPINRFTFPSTVHHLPFSANAGSTPSSCNSTLILSKSKVLPLQSSPTLPSVALRSLRAFFCAVTFWVASHHAFFALVAFSLSFTISMKADSVAIVAIVVSEPCNFLCCSF